MVFYDRPGGVGMQMALMGRIRCQPDGVLVFAFPDPATRSVVPDLAALERRLIRPLRRRPPRRARWRSWIARCLVIARAWPSLGLLPWVVMDLGAVPAIA